LAVAILLVAFGSAYLLFLAPVLDFYSEREALLERDRQSLPHYRAAAEGLPGLRAQAEELRKAESANPITLDGASDPIASANLQGRIPDLAKSAGATIDSMEALAPENQESYRRIGLRIAVSGEYGAVVHLLAAIEKETPPLVLRNLQIRGTTRRTGPSSSGQLDANFEVYGVRSIDAPANPKP